MILFILSLSPLSAKTYDCFLFFNEIEILKIRFAELDEVVDYFVLVESEETFQGNPKPLYFAENKEQFAPYLDKIIHIVIEKHPPTNNPWDREGFQRNGIKRGSSTANDGDIIMVSDCDEIPRKEVMKVIIKLIARRPDRAFAFILDFFEYQLNRPNPDYFCGSVIAAWKLFDQFDPECFRKLRQTPDTTKIVKGGWHFSSMGGDAMVEMKFNNYSHTEYRGKANIRIKKFHALEIVPINERFPQYIIENEEYLKSIGYIAEYEKKEH